MPKILEKILHFVLKLLRIECAGRRSSVTAAPPPTSDTHKCFHCDTQIPLMKQLCAPCAISDLYIRTNH